MKSRLLVAAVGIPLLLAVVLWLPMGIMELMLAFLAGIAGWELFTCLGHAGDARNAAAMSAMLLVLIPRATDGETYMLLLVAYVLLFFARAVWKGGEVKFQELMAHFFCVTAIPYAFTAFLRMWDTGCHRGFLLLPLIYSFASDTFAFFAGLTLGKHKLAPKVSPKKTVEGAVGGLVGSTVGGALFALVMNTWFDQSMAIWAFALLGLGCSVVAQLGDLSFSLIKREFGIKDYGKLFLAHGGVLDRFDSVLFVAPVVALLLPEIL